MTESQREYLTDVELPKKIQEEVDRVAEKRRLSNAQKEKLVEEVKNSYLDGNFEPGDVFGIIAAQSISEPATQMSLPYEERILVKKGEIIYPAEIGSFVDELMGKFGAKMESGSEVLDLDKSMAFYVYSLDSNERLKLKRVKSVIRHKSPKRLLYIKTASGRRIKATDHHSFVIRNDNRVVSVSGKQLKVGDRIPTIKILPENCISEVDVMSILQGKDMVRANGNVYPYVAHSRGLPEKMQLNQSFGWLVGAYISEGNPTKYFVNISNTDEGFNQKVRGFAREFGLTVNEYDNFRGFSKGHDLRINSSLLSNLLKEMCGADSRGKRVPVFAFSAKEEFVSSLLQAYFDGDGSVTLERKGIRASSESRELMDGIALLLSRFGIFCSKSDDGKWLWIPYKYSRVFLERIGTSLKGRKDVLEELIKKYESSKITAEQTDMIPGIGSLLFDISKKLRLPTRDVNNFIKRQRIGRETLRKYLEKFRKISKEKNVDILKETDCLEKAINSDVVWDKIEEISYIDSKGDYVYDISVDGLETFATFGGIITHNTMRTYHFAGSAGIKVTYGLPRLIEIFDAKKRPDTPVMTIFLDRQYNNKDDARKIAESIIEKSVENASKRITINLSENTIDVEPVDARSVDKFASTIKSRFEGMSVRARGGMVVIKAGDEDVKELQKIKEKIMEVKVDGLKGITNAVVRREGENWIINTIGSNLEGVLNMKEVDKKKTTTNDINETAKILGIEAARNLIIREALNTLQEQGLDVDIRHIMLVADIMTMTGEIRPIGRYGIAGTKTSILARAAFEETIKHLVKASIMNETDSFNGIFENVMIGQVIPSGTGMFDLVAKFEEELGTKENSKKEESK